MKAQCLSKLVVLWITPLEKTLWYQECLLCTTKEDAATSAKQHWSEDIQGRSPLLTDLQLILPALLAGEVTNQCATCGTVTKTHHTRPYRIQLRWRLWCSITEDTFLVISYITTSFCFKQTNKEANKNASENRYMIAIILNQLGPCWHPWQCFDTDCYKCYTHGDSQPPTHHTSVPLIHGTSKKLSWVMLWQN